MPTPATAQWPKPNSECEFEDCSVDFLRIRWNDPHASRNGRRGQGQHGIDIVGHPPWLHGRLAGAQCKNVKSVTLATVVKETKRARAFQGKLEEFLLITSADRDARLQAEVRHYFDVHPEGFRVEVIFWQDLVADLSRDARSVAKYWKGFLSRGVRPGIQVRRVTDPYDDDLDEAFELYERRLPDPNVRDASTDIRRWLGELRDEKVAGTAKLEDYLLLARTRTEVCGFLYAQFYPESGFLFVSYLVASEKSATSRKETTHALGEYLKADLRDSLQRCRGVVFELAAPASPTEREGWLGRYYCFARMARQAGVTVKRLEFPYVQPRLSPFEADGYEEAPQYLFYGRVNAAPIEATVSRDEVVALLRVLYMEWYAQAFEHAEKEYAEELEALFVQVARSVPPAVNASDDPRHRWADRR